MAISEALRRQAAFGGRGVLVGALAFFALGMPDGGNGVAWPFMRADLHQPLDALGLITIAATIGAVASSTLSGRGTRAVGAAVLLMVAAVISFASLLGVALSPVWGTAVLCFGVLGCGGGLFDAVVQARIVTTRGLRSMSVLHAGYGVGVTVGPLVMTAILAAGWGWRGGFAIGGAVYLLVGAGLVVTWREWGGGDATPPEVRAALSPSAELRGGATVVVWRSMLLFFLVTALEISAMLWSFTFLTGARGLGTVTAGVGVSAFLGVQTGTRVVLATVGHRTGAAEVLLGSCATVLLGMALVLVLPGAISIAGLVVAGIGLGAVYPSLMVAQSGRLGEERARAVVGYQVAAANTGAAAGSALTGVVLAHAGIGLFPVVELVLVGVVLAMLLTGRSVHRGEDGHLG